MKDKLKKILTNAGLIILAFIILSFVFSSRIENSPESSKNKFTDSENTVYTVIKDSIKTNEQYVYAEYLVTPTAPHIINEFRTMAYNNPNTHSMIIEVVHTLDFKYFQPIGYNMVDKDMNSLNYISNGFDISRYEIIDADSIGYKLAQRIKKLVE